MKVVSGTVAVAASSENLQETIFNKPLALSAERSTQRFNVTFKPKRNSLREAQ
jgi:hypothetical protein